MSITKTAFLTLLFCHTTLFKVVAQETNHYDIDLRINFWKSVSGKLLSITDSSLVVMKNGKSISVPIVDVKVIKVYKYERQALLNTITLLTAIGNIIYAITIDEPLTAVAVGIIGTPVLLVTGFFIHKALNPSVLTIHSKKVPLNRQILSEKLSRYINPLSK